MSKLTIDTNTGKNILIIGGVIVGAYIAYKLYKEISKATGNVADVLGAGPQGDRAEEARKKSISAQSAFSPLWLSAYKKANPGKKITLTTSAWNEYATKEIERLLSYGHNLTHPFSFEEDRRKIDALLRNGIKTKTQLGSFSEYYNKKTGKYLSNTLYNGFLKSSLLTGSDYNRLYADLVNHLNGLS